MGQHAFDLSSNPAILSIVVMVVIGIHATDYRKLLNTLHLYGQVMASRLINMAYS